MILVAVIVGYILGVAPFIVPKIVERIDGNKATKEKAEEVKEQNEIFDEWLNGLSETKQVNQQDIYNEYVTGQETVKGD